MQRRQLCRQRCPWELVAPTPTTARLTVTLAGTGSGTVTASGGGAATQINCPGTCSQSYTLGTGVTLTAAPAATSTFSGFTGGGCSGTATTCAVTMTAAQDVTATFLKRVPPKCTVTASGNKVLLKKARHSKLKPKTLKLSVKCNQAASVRLAGTLIERLRSKPKHGKQKTKRYSVGPARASVVGDTAATLTVKLPASALSALKHGHRESVAITLVGTNPNGTGRAHAAIAALKIHT